MDRKLLMNKLAPIFFCFPPCTAPLWSPFVVTYVYAWQELATSYYFKQTFKLPISYCKKLSTGAEKNMNNDALITLFLIPDKGKLS